MNNEGYLKSKKAEKNKSWTNFLYSKCYLVSQCTLSDERQNIGEFFSFKSSTVCFMDLDLGSQLITFESTLTTFEASVIFWSSCGSCKN
jgi:hypothetical protein